MIFQNPKRTAAGNEVRQIVAEAERKIVEAEARRRSLAYRDALEHELGGIQHRFDEAKARRKALDAEVKASPAALKHDIEIERDFAVRQVDYLAARVLSIQAEIDRIKL